MTKDEIINELKALKEQGVEVRFMGERPQIHMNTLNMGTRFVGIYNDDSLLDIESKIDGINLMLKRQRIKEQNGAVVNELREALS